MSAIAPTQEPAQPKSEIGRLTGVLFEPSAAFADIAARPRWWVPALLLIVLQISYITAFSQRVGWEQYMRQKFESNEQIQKMDPEKREALIQGQAKFAGIAGSVMGPIALILTVLISAALFKGLFSVMDATMPFKSGFAVTWYAMVPSMLSILLSIGVMFLKDPGDFDLEHPLAFNVGAFLNKETTGKFLYRLATSLDLFVIWLVALMGLGYSVATGGKVSAGKSIGTVTVVWLVLILAMAGIASLMPG